MSSAEKKDDVATQSSPKGEAEMITTSEHQFGEKDDPNGFSVTVSEVMQEDYGLFVWPCSIVLAEYVWQQKARFLGSNVVELGAGTALPGIVAAKLGADVTLTDNCKRPQVLENMKRTCDLNGVNCKIMGLTWGEWDSTSFDLHPQIVLGADVLYESRDFDDLLATVSFLLQNAPNTIFITSYERRSGHRLLEYLMMKWNLKCVKLLDAYELIPSCKESMISASIELAEIKIKC